MSAPPRTRRCRSVAILAAPLILATAALAAHPVTASASASRPDGAQLYPPTTDSNSDGNVWSSTWAENGDLYSISDDTSGWNSTCDANFAIEEETGNDPLHLTGRIVNCMTAYGFAGQSAPNQYNWKAESIISIGGTLYASIGNMIYASNGHRQYIENSTIIKSTDNGKTWTPSETQNYNHPMFPYQGFAPFFIQYGQDDNPASTANGGGQYVYAISNNGYYNNGDQIILGRVPRDEIGQLNGADWQSYRGGPGQDSSSWASSSNQAKPLLTDPEQLGSVQAQYDAPLHEYILIPWYWTYATVPLSTSFRFRYHPAAGTATTGATASPTYIRAYCPRPSRLPCRPPGRRRGRTP